MNEKSYTTKARLFKTELKKVMDGDRKVRMSKGEEYVELRQGERFRQCYKPDTPVLEELPEYWFVSRYGTVLTFETGKIKCLRNSPQVCKSYPKITYLDRSDNTKKHCIRVHDLVALVYGSDVFGKANELLQEKGKSAFGSNADPDNVQGHHIADKENIYDPNNVQLMRSGLHRAIELCCKATDEDIDKQAQRAQIMMHELEKDTHGKPAVITESITKDGVTRSHIRADLVEGKAVLHLRRKEDVEFLRTFFFGLRNVLLARKYDFEDLTLDN